MMRYEEDPYAAVMARLEDIYRRGEPMWSLDFSLNAERVARLTGLGATSALPRWDGIGPSGGWGATEPRLVHAGAMFTGGPGREREAAEAWAFELKVYFKRGVREQPAVTYEHGVYTVVGLIQTTHPGDRPRPDGIVWFT
jgi:hypothetical protein